MAVGRRSSVFFAAISVVVLCGVGAAAEELPSVERSSFPRGFVFGTATAAYQYEGAAFEYGKGPSIWDTFSHQPGKIKGNTTGDVAVDQYHRYAEDLWLLKDMNMDAYRFSISWPRIFPKGVGAVNWEGVKYYDSLISHLLDLKIEPYVTLYHWDMPQALEDSLGGWLSPQIVDPFTRYARFCFERWGSKVKYWITFNEIHTFANAGYYSGEMAPGRCSDRSFCSAGNTSTEPYLASHHALLSHAYTVDIYRKEFKDTQKGVIGITTDCTWYDPLDSNSLTDQRAAQESIEGYLGWYLDPIFFGEYPASMRTSIGSNLPRFTKKEAALIKGSQDFVGINHYSSMYATYNSNDKIIVTAYKDGVPIGEPTAAEWLFVAPKGMRKLLGWVRKRYHNPIVYVTENGRDEANTDESRPLADQLKDPERILFYHDYMQNVLLAIKDGADIRGYFAWSLMDNFEWAVGYTVRFGLYYVDYKNGLARYPKSSVYWFQQILKRGSNLS